MDKIVARNKKARHDYDIVDTIEVGIILTGQEVKSCRLGNISLTGSYVSLLRGKPVLKGMKISAYSYASKLENYDPGTDRQLLLKSREITKLMNQLDEKGISLVPLEVHANRTIKIILGLGKGRKRHDKRHKIKAQDIEKRLRKGDDY